MSAPRSSLGAGLVLSGAAALTTWVSILSWRGFTDAPSAFLSPLLGLGLLVAGVGAVGRWSRLGALSVLGLQVLLGGIALSWILVGSPLPVGSAWDALLLVFTDAASDARVYAPPVPTAEAAVEPLLLAGGLGCLLLVDLLACGLRRVSAGRPAAAHRLQRAGQPARHRPDLVGVRTVRPGLPRSALPAGERAGGPLGTHALRPGQP